MTNQTFGGSNGYITVDRYANELVVSGTIAGSATRTLLVCAVDTTRQMFTASPAGLSPVAISYGAYKNTTINAFGGTATPASASSGNYSLRAANASGSAGLIQSEALATLQYNSIRVSQKIYGPNGLPICGTRCIQPLVSVNQWVDIGFGMLGVLAGIAGIFFAGPLIAGAAMAAACAGIFASVVGMIYFL